MPYIKDTFSILAECAAIDLPDTQRVVRESEVRSGYEDIEEAADTYCITAEMVPVIQIENEFYTEAQLLAPFMRDAEIRSMAEALDCIAEANHLPAKSVGLLIESNCAVSEMIQKACQKESSKVKDAVMNKIGKATDLAKELKSKGYPVKRKKGKLNETVYPDGSYTADEREKMAKKREAERVAREKEKEAKRKAKEAKDAAKEKEYQERMKNKALQNQRESVEDLFNF
jgi:hypothetical protein